MHSLVKLLKSVGLRFGLGSRALAKGSGFRAPEEVLPRNAEEARCFPRAETSNDKVATGNLQTSRLLFELRMSSARKLQLQGAEARKAPCLLPQS